MRASEIILPITLPSVANLREHWAVRARRIRGQRLATRLAVGTLLVCPTCDLAPPWAVRITRIAPRALDSHDNLRSACKAVVDGIADALDLLTDADTRVSWEYAQARSPLAHQSAVSVRIHRRVE